jgi:hypothetical protein
MNHPQLSKKSPPKKTKHKRKNFDYSFSHKEPLYQRLTVYPIPCLNALNQENNALNQKKGKICRMAVYITENKSVNPFQPEIATSKLSNTGLVLIGSMANIQQLIEMLERFNQAHTPLFQAKRQDLYNTFHIPKNSGGTRRIDAPCPEISAALKYLKVILEAHFAPYAHDAAFAYVKHRSTIDAIKRHQSNQSRWFLKLDFENFFGNSTFEFIMDSLSKIYPFSEIMKQKQGRLALGDALELCFLSGSLPQGSPMSPFMTNLMMIPIDYEISEMLKRVNRGKHYVYTRYADDMIISCTEGFDVDRIQSEINKILVRHRAPFPINPNKTRYGSSAGKNWNLGVMLNKDNKITIGHKKKRDFKAMLDNYIRNHDNWSLYDVQVLQGLMNYYNMIESDYITHTITATNTKYKVDVKQMMYNDLSV